MSPVGGDGISVAICTFNGAAYVAEQIDSILRQTRAVSEIVLADDGSTDESIEIVRAKVERVASDGRPALNILKPGPKPLGYIRNFERAIRACSGEYIALSDQDDVWASNKLEVAVGMLEADPNVSMFASNAELIGAQGETMNRTVFDVRGAPTRPPGSHRAKIEPLLQANRFPGMTLVMRRGFAHSALPLPSDWPHDYWLVLTAAAGHGLVFSDAPLVRYRQHQANTVGVRGEGSFAALRSHVRRALAGEPARADPWEDADAVRRLLDLASATPTRALIDGKVTFEQERARMRSRKLLKRIVHVISRIPDYRQFRISPAASVLRDALGRG